MNQTRQTIEDSQHANEGVSDSLETEQAINTPNEFNKNPPEYVPGTIESGCILKGTIKRKASSDTNRFVACQIGDSNVEIPITVSEHTHVTGNAYLSAVTVSVRNYTYTVITGVHKTKQKAQKQILRNEKLTGIIRLVETTHDLTPHNAYENPSESTKNNDNHLDPTGELTNHITLEFGVQTRVPNRIQAMILNRVKHPSKFNISTMLLFFAGLPPIALFIQSAATKLILISIWVTGLVFTNRTARHSTKTKEYTVVKNDIVSENQINKWSIETIRHQDTLTTNDTTNSGMTPPHERTDHIDKQTEGTTDTDTHASDVNASTTDVRSVTVTVQENTDNITLCSEIDNENITWTGEQNISGMYPRLYRRLLNDKETYDGELPVTVTKLPGETSESTESTRDETKELLHSDCGTWGIQVT